MSNKTLYENIMAYTGIFLAFVSISTSLFLPDDLKKFTAPLGGLSVALFLAGSYGKIDRIDKFITNNHSQSSKSLDKIKKDLAWALGDKRLHIKTTTKIFADYTWNSVFDNGDQLLQHIKNENQKTITVDNITPAYELMHELMRELGDKHVYIATSKLESYRTLESTNENFKRFSFNLKDKARNGNIKAFRLYYLDEEPDEEKLQEMREAQDNKIVVRYINLGSSFKNSRDLAFIAEAKGNNLISPDSSDPLRELDEKNYEKICAIEFHLDSNLNESVSKMELTSPSYGTVYSKYVAEFRENWSRAISPASQRTS